jgi:hypothetical protein
VDEVDDIHSIAYDWKQKYIVHRTTKKRRITLDRSIPINHRGKSNKYKVKPKHLNLLVQGMTITDATPDREKRDEEELAIALKELEHLRHLEKYYQDTTQAVVFLRSEFKEAYKKFIDERHMFTARIAEMQEDNLMVLAT